VDGSQFVSEKLFAEFTIRKPTRASPPAAPALGLIVLASDQTIEYEFRRMDGVCQASAFMNPAIYNASQVTPEALHAPGKRKLHRVQKLILPGLPIDVMGVRLQFPAR